MLHGLAYQTGENVPSWLHRGATLFAGPQRSPSLSFFFAFRIGSTCIWPGRGLQLLTGCPCPQKAQKSELARYEGEKAQRAVRSGCPGPMVGENMSVWLPSSSRTWLRWASCTLKRGRKAGSVGFHDGSWGFYWPDESYTFSWELTLWEDNNWGRPRGHKRSWANRTNWICGDCLG